MPASFLLPLFCYLFFTIINDKYLSYIYILEEYNEAMQKQLDNIIDICQGKKELTQFRLRFMIRTIARNMKDMQQYKQNQSVVKNQNDQSTREMNISLIKDEQIQAIKQQFEEKIQHIKLLIQKKLEYFQQIDQKIEKFAEINQSRIQYLDQYFSKETQSFKNIVAQEFDKFYPELQQCKILKKNMENNSQYFQSKIKIDQKNMINLLVQLQQTFENIKQQCFYDKERDISLTIYSYVDKPVDAINWLNPQTRDYDKFTIKMNQIMLSQLDTGIVFGKFHLKRSFCFSIKLVKTKGEVGVGIINSELSKSLILCQSKDWFGYWNYGGCRMGGEWQTQKGKGFKEGETVRVQGNLQEGIIEWWVGNEIRYYLYHEKLKAQRIEWVPFIYLHSPMDLISIYADQ